MHVNLFDGLMQELHPATDATSDRDPDALVRRIYDTPGPLVRWNMISTLDGSAVGSDGVTGSINNAADHRVFGFLRAWADAVVVGAGTIRAERYSSLGRTRWRSMREGRRDVPLLVVVSRRPTLPPTLADADEDDVLLLQGDPVEPASAIGRLRDLGHQRIVLEGGPTLASAFVEAGVVDELCLTIVPTLVGGDGARITAGRDLAATARLTSVLEEDGTLLTRWTL